MARHRSNRMVLLFGLGLLVSPRASVAGMPSYDLNDVYRLRFEEISFFLVLLLMCALALKFLWNHAAKGFSFLPQIKYRHALCLSLILGVAMLLVLAMISGIREVLTPGAWRRQGSTYRLNDPAQEPIRRRSLEQLGAALQDYARSHNGSFPPHDYVPEIASKLWESPDQQGSHYVYFPGRVTSEPTALLASEPLSFGEYRFTLTVGGVIEKLDNEEIKRRAWVKPKP